MLANWDSAGADIEQDELIGLIAAILKRTTGENVAVTLDERILYAVGWHVAVKGNIWSITPIDF